MSATTHRTPGETFAGYTQLETLTCPTCGVLHAIPEHMARSRREDGEDCYCPNGHVYSWTPKKERERIERQRDEARDRAAREAALREQAEASARAQRGAATRARNERNAVKRRVAHGVCPCCHRSFKQLRAHVARMHPEALEGVDAA